ncbi:LysM-like peptidoglycan-binding domain-containing protein [Vibrio sp. Hep-1b-8]|uniref:LysM-like peptidoglycan-binding domain-containing protein n=1 Tax=Vibrio sp. Hep-1b-8 TaxID=2144187 RepID=UPI001110D8E4|nr:LysM-like peptidoglycan-binding domain-containing protein [Vibrio sp. Hep-1b-8]TMX35266.1 lysine transporter LysM [Vibrio sp. Hep-1b-8]
MNRRKKKKQQQVDYVDVVKKKFSAIDWLKLKGAVLQRWNLLPQLHQRGLMILVPVLLVLLVIPLPDSTGGTESQTSPVQRVEIDIDTRSLSEQQSRQQQSLASDTWKEYQVKSGDTLAQVFRSNGLAMADLNALVKVEGADKPLSQIKQGQLVRFKLAENGQLDILQLEKNNQSVMFFRLSDGGFGRSK